MANPLSSENTDNPDVVEATNDLITELGQVTGTKAFWTDGYLVATAITAGTQGNTLGAIFKVTEPNGTLSVGVSADSGGADVLVEIASDSESQATSTLGDIIAAVENNFYAAQFIKLTLAPGRHPSEVGPYTETGGGELTGGTGGILPATEWQSLEAAGLITNDSEQHLLAFTDMEADGATELLDLSTYGNTTPAVKASGVYAVTVYMSPWNSSMTAVAELRLGDFTVQSGYIWSADGGGGGGGQPLSGPTASLTQYLHASEQISVSVAYDNEEELTFAMFVQVQRVS